jgi:small-conductance mechanosensitive channel
VPELSRTFDQLSIWGLPLTFILAGALFGYMIEWVFLHRALLDDHQIIVPNSRLGDSILTNFTLPHSYLWTRIDVSVHYDSDLQHVERVALEVAREVVAQVPGGRADQEPLIRFSGFGDSSVDFTMFILTDEFAERLRVQHEFIKQLHARFAEEGIVIPFPIRTLHLPEPLQMADRAAHEGKA